LVQRNEDEAEFVWVQPARQPEIQHPDSQRQRQRSYKRDRCHSGYWGDTIGITQFHGVNRPGFQREVRQLLKPSAHPVQ